MSRREIEARFAAVRNTLFTHIENAGRIKVVKAPPGSGKTHLLLEAVEHAQKQGARIAVATQTNSQAEDICRRLAAKHVRVNTIRFAADAAIKPCDFPASVTWQTKANALPHTPCVVVGTAAKWGLVSPFDFLFVEEAWQLAWADFMLLAQVSSRFVLIGDPGQIPPVVSIDVSRWQTAPVAPHRPAPQQILDSHAAANPCLSLPATRRLPHDTAALIRPFYEFSFESFAGPGERRVTATGPRRDAYDAVIDLLAGGSTAAMSLSTPFGGPPLELDDEVATGAVNVVERLLDRGAVAEIDGENQLLQPSDIGICATHRVMNAAMQLRLRKGLRNIVRVDTPERWQGLQCKVMVVVHPLSGIVEPSGFDLETGRLCVMASRHRAGLILIGRDHIGSTLRDYLPVADQAPGCEDIVGRGHERNRRFWETLEDAGRVISAA